MKTANVAPLRGRPLLAFRGAVIFSLLDLCFDMVEVGGSNPPVPTKFLSLFVYCILFFQDRAFWRALVRGHDRGKVVIGQLPCKGVQPIKTLAVNPTCPQ